MSADERMNKTSKKSYLKDEADLKSVIEQMEAEDLLIKMGETVVLMNDWLFNIIYLLIYLQAQL